MRIALADDEQELLDQVSSVILSAGHEVDGYRNGLDLQNALRRETYDVVLLDWNMPDRSGLDVLNWATENLSPMPPFILLTSRHDKEDIVRGLEAGAIDYIVKPESDDVIRARVEAAGRRTKADTLPSTTSVGPYVFDRREKSATLSGESVHLTAKEFDLLDLLLQNLGRPLSRGYLFSKVWGSEADLETRTIDVHVSRLRGKLDLKPENGFVIRTVFGFGYRMDEYIEDADNNE